MRLTSTDIKNSIEALLDGINREGICGLQNWLRDIGFYESPASRGHHGAYTGGLARHSLNVFHRLHENVLRMGLDVPVDTIKIVGLLHDVCKAGMYEQDADGKWIVNDPFPLGHGEKSLYLVSRIIPLTDQEALAIRWHMNAYERSEFNRASLDAACKMDPFVVATFTADYVASTLEGMPK